MAIKEFTVRLLEDSDGFTRPEDMTVNVITIQSDSESTALDTAEELFPNCSIISIELCFP